jgi:hypothetical protein
VDNGGNDGSKRLCRESGYELMRETMRCDAMRVRSRVATRDVQRKNKIITGEWDETRISNLIR